MCYMIDFFCFRDPKNIIFGCRTSQDPSQKKRYRFRAAKGDLVGCYHRFESQKTLTGTDRYEWYNIPRNLYRRRGSFNLMSLFPTSRTSLIPWTTE